MVPTGMRSSGIVLPGFTSTAFVEEMTLSPAFTTLWRDDVGLLAVIIGHQSDPCCTVGIILETLDGALTTSNLTRLKSTRRYVRL